MKNIDTLPILTIDTSERELRDISKSISDPQHPDIQKLIPIMAETLRATPNGFALAAPQVGKKVRLCIIKDEDSFFVLINPVITARSRKMVVMEEGCLSVPGKYFQIKRPEAIKVRFLDDRGKKGKIKAGGLLARAVQHEIDHLDGILVIDRIKRASVKKQLK